MKNLLAVYGVSSIVDLCQTLYALNFKGLIESNPIFFGMSPIPMIIFKTAGTIFVIGIIVLLYNKSKRDGWEQLVYYATMFVALLQLVSIVGNTIVLL
jgi:hypothetical protein